MKRITLSKLYDSTTMEVFLYVKQHLLTQNEASKEGTPDGLSGNMCVYRSSNKLKCAAGCLMTTREYRKSFEKKSWSTLVNAGLVPSAHKKLIQALQNCHDEYKVSAWKTRLDEIEEQIKEGYYDE